MLKKKWKHRLLSLALSVALAIPGTLPAYASESIFLEAEEESADFAKETVLMETAVQEPVLKEMELADAEKSVNEEEPELELSEEETDASSLGYFEDVEMRFSGFMVLVKGKFYCLGDQNQDDIPLEIVQYDASGNCLCATNIGVISQGEMAETNISNSVCVHPDAAYIRLEAGYGDTISRSEKIEAQEHPKVTFTAKLTEVGVESVLCDISYTGDLQMKDEENNYVSQFVSVVLNVGTGQDRSTWKETSSGYANFFGDNNKDTAWINNLSENTTYYGEVIVYGDVYDHRTYNSIRIFEQRIPIDSFTTKSNETYSIQTLFPDEVLRGKVEEEIGEVTDGTVTAADLEKIESLYIGRQNYEAPAIKDISGIDKLERLRQLDLRNHEITSGVEIDWSKLKHLEYLGLEGNNLTEVPDVSQNHKLQNFYITDNKFTEEELDNSIRKLPEKIASYSIRTAKSSQRDQGFILKTEESYYIYPSGSEIVFLPYGFRKEFSEEIKIYVNGEEQEYEIRNPNNFYFYVLKNKNFKEGSYTVKAELYYGETKAEETPEYTFQVSDEEWFSKNEPYYKSEDTRKESDWSVCVYSTCDSYLLQSVDLVDKSGKIYGESGIRGTNIQSHEPRYEKLNYYSDENQIWETQIRIQPVYNFTPAGTYDYKLKFQDGSFKIIEDTFVFLPKEETVITEVFLGYSYDNTGDHLYLFVYGQNLEPEKFTYTIESNGKKLPVRYVDYKPVNKGILVKLQKEGWTVLPEEEDVLKFTVSGGNEATTYSGSSSIRTGFYYTAYNIATNKVFVAITDNLNAEGKNIKFYLRNAYLGNYENQAYAEAVIKDGVAELEFKNADGTKYLFQNAFYNIAFEMDSKVYDNNFQVYGLDVYGTASVDDRAGIEEVAETGFVEEQVSKESDVVTDREVKQKDSAELTAKGKKFILTSIHGSWNTDSEMIITMNATGIAKNDKYTVTLTDCNGQEVKGLNITPKYQYSGQMSFMVQGLKYEDAAKRYYIKIIHNTLGEPVNSSGSSYYQDKRGEYKDIYYTSIASNQIKNRMVALNIGKRELPITVQIYHPYDTALLAGEVIKSQSQLTNGWFYFSKEFSDSLPFKNMVYDVVCLRHNGMVYATSGMIDCEDNLKTGWNYTIDKTNLYVNEEENKTAVLTVLESKGKPSFKSSDTSVVTVKADASDSNKAILTAVGLGTAQISITADGAIRKFDVVCERKVTLERMELSHKEMTLGAGQFQEICVNLFPAEAWKEEMEITFTTDRPEVISIREGKTTGTAEIIALKEGNAIVTAAIEGTELTAQCSVIVEKVFGEEEKAALKQQASKNYVLDNLYPQNTLMLKDVVLPEGWTWLEETIKLTAEETVPVHYYAAEYKAEGYESFTALLPVFVSRLTAAEIVGKEILKGTETENYRVKAEYKGYRPKAEEFASVLNYVWEVSDSAIAEDTKANGSGFEVTAKAVAEKTATKIILNVTAGENVFKDELSLTVVSADCIDKIEMIVSEEPSEQKPGSYEYHQEDEMPVLAVDSREIKDSEKILNVYAKGYSGNSEAEPEKGFVWSVTNPDIVEVKTANDTKKAELVFKKVGSVILSVMAQDDGKCVQQILVSVNDYEPFLENSNIKFEYYAKNGLQLPVKMQNGNRAESVAVEEMDAKTKEWKESSKFFAEKEEEILRLKTRDSYQPGKNEKVKVRFRITTEKIAEVFLDATISVDVKTKPKATLKAVSKANLFYTNAEANYQISSKYEIESIEDITVKEGDTYRGRMEENGYRLGDYDLSEGTVSFHSGSTLSAETLSLYKAKNSKLCQVTLKIKFKDYAETVDQILTVKVALEDKKPALKLNDVMLLSGQTESTAGIYDTKNKTEYRMESGDGRTILSETKGVQLGLTKEGKVKVVYDAAKKINYKARLTSEQWTREVILKGKITTGTALKQKMNLDTTKIILNTAYNIQEHGKIAVGVSIKNNDTKIEKISYQIDKKNAVLFNNGSLAVTYSKKEQKVYVGLNKDMCKDIKPGNYKVNLIGKILVNGKEETLKLTPLTIQITDRIPEITLKAKGSIDLVRRNYTYVVYQPKMKNITAKIKEVILSGSYANYFEAELLENGTFRVRAVDEAVMSSKNTYPVTVKMILDHGSEMISEVKIKPVNKIPKLKAELTKGTLYRSVPEGIRFRLTGMDSMTKISRMELVKDQNSDYFDLQYVGEKEAVISKAKENINPGKYVISYKVYLKGEEYNGKTATLKFTVTVK